MLFVIVVFVIVISYCCLFNCLVDKTKAEGTLIRPLLLISQPAVVIIVVIAVIVVIVVVITFVIVVIVVIVTSITM